MLRKDSKGGSSERRLTVRQFDSNSIIADDSGGSPGFAFHFIVASEKTAD